jgi:dimethylhistidine N-methyltransferase
MNAVAGAVAFIDLKPGIEDFERAVLEGLSQQPKWLPARYFYDERGSQLFEEICKTEEYYLTRTELALLDTSGSDIADLAGSGRVVVEYGSGSSAKIKRLLGTLDAPAGLVAIDISATPLRRAVAEIASRIPRVAVTGLCADFLEMVDLPSDLDGGGPRLGYFSGSTIGNLAPPDAVEFLKRVRRHLGPDGAFLVAVDRKKDERRLWAAYNDAEGITAAFNLNILNRIVSELDTDLDPATFEHLAFYNAKEGRIEMHLRSRVRQIVDIAGRRFAFAPGETIHTESSYKYHPEEFADLARRGGFTPRATWSDPEALFSLHYLQPGA